ncbi:MAG: hypothetical protein HYV34_00670 [Candidatus Kerfeldbacteria bacterium]|nr:hypothetical protein [Candidatus Kerfeldbacteria bacterium]
MRHWIPAAIAAAMFALTGCGDTAAPAGPDNYPEPRSSSCPEVIHTSPDGSKVGPKVDFLQIRNGKLFVPELNDSTAYMVAEFFSPDGSVPAITEMGTRLDDGTEFVGLTCERPTVNVKCVDDNLTVWSYVDSLSAEGLTGFTVWQDPTTKEWAYQWICTPEPPDDDPFAGCDIIPNSVKFDTESGEWWATSTIQGSLVRVDDDGIWISTDTPWTDLWWFGERGIAAGVEHAVIGSNGFVAAPTDTALHDLNMGYYCNSDTSRVWSLLVDSTPLPTGAKIVRHASGDAAIRITAWMRKSFDGCPIVYNSEHPAQNGPWMEATSTEQARMTRVTEEGVYFERGPWTDVQFFGEMGWAAKVLTVPLQERGNEMFAPRPTGEDSTLTQCNLTYWCEPDIELVWSLIVWETFVPAGASIVEHPGMGKAYQIDLWRDGGETEPGDCDGGCPDIVFQPNVGPMVEDLRRDGRVVSWEGCYPEAFVQDSRGFEWGYWAQATEMNGRWVLDIPEGWDLFTPACEQRVWSYVPEGGTPPEGFLIWCDGRSCTWQLDPDQGINSFEPEGTIRLNIGVR